MVDDLSQVNPDFWQNLTNWGFATMANGAQPGAKTLGAIGQGGLQMANMARQGNLQRQQAALYQSEAQKNQMQSLLIPYQMRMMQQQANIMQAAFGDQSGGGGNTASTGMPYSSVAGSPSPTPKTTSTPSSSPMSDENVDKLKELYPESVPTSGGLSSPQGGVVPLTGGTQEQSSTVPTITAPAQQSRGARPPNKQEMALTFLGAAPLAAEMYKTSAAPVIAGESKKAELPYAMAEKAGSEFYGKDKEIYQSAQNTLANMDQLEAAIEELNKTPGYWNTGGGGQGRLEFAKTVNNWQQAAFPGTTPAFDPTKVGTAEQLNSQSKIAGMQLAKELFGGQREAATIINATISTKPGLETTYQGSKRIIAGLREASKYNVDKRNFEVQWLQAHPGDLTGAEEEFNKARPPEAYAKRGISQVQPIKVNKPGAIKSLLPGTRFIAPDGTVRTVPGDENG